MWFYRKTCRENKLIEGNNKNRFVCENGGKYGKKHDVVISEDFTIESYKQSVLSFDSVREKEALYKIDFNQV